MKNWSTKSSGTPVPPMLSIVRSDTEAHSTEDLCGDDDCPLGCGLLKWMGCGDDPLNPKAMGEA